MYNHLYANLNSDRRDRKSRYGQYRVHVADRIHERKLLKKQRRGEKEENALPRHICHDPSLPLIRHSFSVPTRRAKDNTESTAKSTEIEQEESLTLELHSPVFGGVFLESRVRC